MAVFIPPLDRLLVPISVVRPGGESIRYTETYDAIQEARRADDPSLPMGIWQRELKKADWTALADLCEEAIQNRSKDLYLAVWLVEAWLHRHGAAGVAAGMELLHGLCRDLWDDLYPQVDPDDPDVRAAPFEWLNDKLPIALGLVTVTQPDSADALPYTWADVVTVREPRARGVPDDDAVTATRLQNSLALTPVTWLRELAGQVTTAVEATRRLMALLRERQPAAPPSLRRIEEALLDVQRWTHSVVEERAERAPLPSAPDTPPAEPGETSMPLPEDGVVRSREEAYRLLSLAADYLLRTEPHSPTPYLVRRAVNWGKLPLAELLEEYSQDGNDLRMLRVLLGINESS